jgi:hypothetical protein
VKAAPVLLLLAVLLSACSDAFDPFVESDQTFALYGFLDARRDTQFVRVEAITERAEAGSTVEARVTSTDLVTAETTVWQDSLVRLDDGTEGTVFLAPFRPEPGRTYRITAARPDRPEAASEAVVTLPAEPPLTIAEPEVIAAEFVAQRLTIGSGAEPEDVRVTYTVRHVGADEPARFSFGYNATPARGNGYEVVVALRRDADEIRSILGIEPDDVGSVALVGLEVAYGIVAEGQTGVTGGVGRFGSAAAFSSMWTLAPEFVEAIGFVDAQDGGRASRGLRP